MNKLERLLDNVQRYEDARDKLYVAIAMELPGIAINNMPPISVIKSWLVDRIELEKLRNA